MKIETDAELEKIHQAILTDLETAHKAERLLGYSCFTEDAREKIKVLNMLYTLFEFNRTTNEFYEALQKKLTEMSCNKMSKRTEHYITKKTNGG